MRIMSEVRQFGAVIWSFIGWLEALEGERTYVSWLDCDLGGVYDAIGIGTFFAGHIDGCFQGCES
jgi:hypothetical protein